MGLFDYIHRQGGMPQAELLQKLQLPGSGGGMAWQNPFGRARIAEEERIKFLKLVLEQQLRNAQRNVPFSASNRQR